MVAWVAVVATFVGLLVGGILSGGAAICAGFGIGMVAAAVYILSLDAFKKYRTDKESFAAGYHTPVIAMLSLGLAIPIHYIIAAFGRRPYLEGKLSSLAKQAETDDKKMGTYLREFHEKLRVAIVQDLQIKEADLVKLQGLGNPLKGEEQRLQQEIDGHKRALKELDAVKTFYS